MIKWSRIFRSSLIYISIPSCWIPIDLQLASSPFYYLFIFSYMWVKAKGKNIFSVTTYKNIFTCFGAYLTPNNFSILISQGNRLVLSSESCWSKFFLFNAFRFFMVCKVTYTCVNTYKFLQWGIFPFQGVGMYV